MIGASKATTYLTFTEDAIADQNQNKVQPRDTGVSALHVSEYGRDATDPVLEEFDLSLQDETLTLRFSETVRSSTLDIPSITIQRKDGSVLFTLSNNSTNVSPKYDFAEVDAVEVDGSGDGDSAMPLVAMPYSTNFKQLVIQLGTSDLNQIKRLTTLATEAADTFIVVTDTMVDDMDLNGDVRNDVVAVVTSDEHQVTTFAEDKISPTLLTYCLNMDTDAAVLRMVFDETVDGSSLVIDELTFQSSGTSSSGR